VQELHGRFPQAVPGQGGDLREQSPQGVLHVAAVGAGVVHEQADPAAAPLHAQEDRQRQDEERVAGLALGPELDAGPAPAQVDGQEAVQRSSLSTDGAVFRPAQA
jgi:hypothetical protein